MVATLNAWTLVTDTTAQLGGVNAAFTIGGTAGDNRLLVAKVSSAAGALTTPTALTYGGRAMTQVAQQNSTSGRDLHSSIWTLDDAEIELASNDQFDMTTSGSQQFRLAATALNAVDQVDPIVDSDSSQSSSAGTAPVIPQLTSTTDGFCIATIAGNRGEDDAPDPDVLWSNMTERLEDLGTQSYNSIADQPTTGLTFDPDPALTGPSNLFSHFIGVVVRNASNPDAAVTIAGTGDISAGTEKEQESSSSIAGTGAVAVAPQVIKSSSVGIVGAGEIAAGNELSKPTSAAIAGQGEITATTDQLVIKSSGVGIAGQGEITVRTVKTDLFEVIPKDTSGTSAEFPDDFDMFPGPTMHDLDEDDFEAMLPALVQALLISDQ